MTYHTGHVKRNPESGDIAIRTIFEGGQPIQSAMMEWLVSSPITGARHTWTTEVEDWDDLYVAPEPPPPPAPYVPQV